ncbi:UDP-N-acetylmuramate dehydrogenase [Pediococcus claussenii]|uniref:UDP-N-acetylenolpyruvoylglucosamine reductase n=1 Tax=Pediococcus claussenii (strain ATCC BAA-344 / DSM 14800 / JCM 18046 / KCTC 3811 / LMG 21948 / P06) TaxID=701521 RepID=G8PC50_PEDCP|nr:UDP-N-acetylmuramate dehydrogenase [Pediococcus claussenii]AEV94869.1 UDP-N-acetylenolpyruvoylglucosamine reductase [Pediococcus claussenii ATCC BAA-344]ANZ70065.1 UDP-N-acetylenolpyruvoylglucosamine reductase [Pediococcus claussenii]ANZ71880.1 UDP-N-acetylenolpyruvoylglucosamine reductase [Pediococcus claussenii]KRN21047.1 murB protein [Pediococcus claussenii]
MRTSIDEAFPEMRILSDEPLSKYTNTKTGGPADVLVFPESVTETKRLVLWAKETQTPLTVIGNASNLIVRDGGIRGLTLILTKLNHVTVDNNEVLAEAGAALIQTTEVAYENGLTGIEFAAGIPGSIGGAVFMNAGAYGGEISEVVSEAEVLTRDGEIKRLTNRELDFGYRHSSVQDYDDIVLSATFKLRSGDKTKIRSRMDELNFLRASKQPLEYPSCGSVFKRPTGYFTGKLIHEAGLQGFTIGGAQVSKKHAGFIINVGGATATDYLDVIHYVQEKVNEQFGVPLETEVRIIGEEK